MKTNKTENAETPALPQGDVKCQLAISALERIANPLKHLQDEAKAHGALGIDGGFAIQLMNDANWYREMAKSALAEIANCT